MVLSGNGLNQPDRTCIYRPPAVKDHFYNSLEGSLNTGYTVDYKISMIIKLTVKTVEQIMDYYYNATNPIKQFK